MKAINPIAKMASTIRSHSRFRTKIETAKESRIAIVALIFADLEMDRLSLQSRTIAPIALCSKSHFSAFGLLFANSAAAIKKKTVEGQSGIKRPAIPNPTEQKPSAVNRILNPASRNGPAEARKP